MFEGPFIYRATGFVLDAPIISVYKECSDDLLKLIKDWDDE